MSGACSGPSSLASSSLRDHCSDPAPGASDPAALFGALVSGRVPLEVRGARGGESSELHAQCRLVELRGAQVASFREGGGAELLCLPQVFKLFLKHLVGGLHTIYTKLKRLNIAPHVCTVEQVRALRSLGAIQPGVNRCKLITRADFDALYRDCTCASSRPGRPPKRSVGVANLMDGSRFLPFHLLNPYLLSQTGVAESGAMAEALRLQKVRMMMGFHGNSHQNQPYKGGKSDDDITGGSDPSEEREPHLLPAPPHSVVPSLSSASLHLNTLQQQSSLLASQLSDLPFMVMPHPLLPVGLPPASVAMAMSQMNQLSRLATMVSTSQIQMEENKLTDTPPGGPSPGPTQSTNELRPLEGNSQSSSGDSSSVSSPYPAAHTPEHVMLKHEQEDVEVEIEEKDENSLLKPANKKMTSQQLSIKNANLALNPLRLAEELSSIETLLTNIQGLLKVAVLSARSQSKQNQTERKELKLELERERDARHSLQRQLSSELHNTAWIQRQLKKEKKAKRRLQGALESRWREQVDATHTH